MPTFQQAVEDFTRIRTFKSSTLRDMPKRLKNVSDWMELPITSISKAMILERHNAISTRDSDKGTGKANANSVMRIVRAVLNFSVAYYDTPDGSPVLMRNPANILSATRAWNKIKPRKRIIVYELERWLTSVLNHKNETLRDYFLFLLLTGCRKCEGSELQWKDVDLKHGYAVLKDTKNGSDHNVALSDVLWEMLRLRKERAISDYVFNGARQNAPLSPHFKAYENISEQSGVKFSPHDLRRTFATIADSLDVERATIKRMVNHAESDVTSGYIVRLPDRLREPMQRVTDAILDRAKADKLTVLNKLRESAGKKLVAGKATYGELADAYLGSVTVCKGSLYEYQKRVYLSGEWADLQMSQIKPAMIKERYEFLKEHYSVNVADKAMGMVHSIFLFASHNYVDRKMTSPVVWKNLRTSVEKQKASSSQIMHKRMLKNI